MNKQQLLEALATKFERLLSVSERSDIEGVKYYLANVFDTAHDTARTINVMFFVQDEGSPNETAYWGNSEPKPTPAPPDFAQQAQAWLQTHIDVTVDNNNVRKFDQFSADNIQQRARARLTLEHKDTGVLTTIYVALWKTADTFQYKIIT